MLHEYIVFQLNNFIHNGFLHLQERRGKVKKAEGEKIAFLGFGKGI